jgi:DNA-binding CsgD family transcriptional regulator
MSAIRSESTTRRIHKTVDERKGRPLSPEIGEEEGMDDDTAIIRDIYATAFDEQPWQDVVARTARRVDAHAAFLFTTFLPDSDGGLFVPYGMPQNEARQFVSEVATVDVWFHELLRRNGPLRTGFRWHTDSLVSHDDLRRTRFFADYLVPCDIGRNLGVMVGDGTSEPLPLSPLCVYRPMRSVPFSTADDDVLRRLGEHFTQAMMIRQRLRAAMNGPASLAVERVSTALVVLARDRRIVLANPAAESLFAAGGPPLVREGRLCAADPADRAALDKAIESCATYRFDARFSLSVRLQGPLGRGVVARIAPVPPAAQTSTKAAAIAFVMREGQSPLDVHAIARTVYKLTSAESELVKHLAEGFTIEESAARRKVGVATARTQLRAVFAKTGTRRQADLMRLLYSISR